MKLRSAWWSCMVCLAVLGMGRAEPCAGAEPPAPHGSTTTNATSTTATSAVTTSMVSHGSLRFDSHGGYLGNLSCAAARCHGGPHPGRRRSDDPRGGEFQTWLATDPHARSARTLGTEASKDMLRALGILVDGEVVDVEGYRNCQQCHDPGRADPDHVRPGSSIGCEDCHGPAESWLARHLRSDWDAEAAAADGWIGLADLDVRARQCAGCHVGGHDREVNHDLIAAGHPRLHFEMARYHNRLPKHWRGDVPEDSMEQQLRLWLAGQVAVADASLELLVARTDASRATSVWPEFSEYNCGACHYALAIRSARGPAAVSTTLPGWGDWSFASPRRLLDAAADDEPRFDRELADQLAELEAVMERLDADRGRAAALAAGAQASLGEWHREIGGRLTPERIASALDTTLLEAAGERPGSWEEAVHLYLAALARYGAAWRADPNPERRALLLELEATLQYAPGRASPLFLDDVGAEPGSDLPVDRFTRGFQRLLTDGVSAPPDPDGTEARRRSPPAGHAGLSNH